MVPRYDSTAERLLAKLDAAEAELKVVADARKWLTIGLPWCTGIAVGSWIVGWLSIILDAKIIDDFVGVVTLGCLAVGIMCWIMYALYTSGRPKYRDAEVEVAKARAAYHQRIMLIQYIQDRRDAGELNIGDLMRDEGVG